MTTQAIQYYANKLKERELGLAERTQRESERHNVEVELENARHNREYESETAQHNRANEEIARQEYAENARHNAATEKISDKTGTMSGIGSIARGFGAGALVASIPTAVGAAVKSYQTHKNMKAAKEALGYGTAKSTPTVKVPALGSNVGVAALIGSMAMPSLVETMSDGDISQFSKKIVQDVNGDTVTFVLTEDGRWQEVKRVSSSGTRKPIMN